MIKSSEYQVLTLNADLSPYGTLSWKDAIRAIFRKIAQPLEFYDKAISSPSTTIQIPAVIHLKKYVNLYHQANFTRRNVFLAYGMTCAFCNKSFRTEHLTFEHVIPRSKGGETSWKNIVPACEPCNHKKADKTPAEAGMPLQYKIYHPLEKDIIEKNIKLSFEEPPHESWNDYLSEIYWNSPLIEE